MSSDHYVPTAIITGSTAGIGKAIAMDLAKEGYSIILTGRREEKMVTGLIDNIESITGRKKSCFYVQGDISEASTREKIVNTVKNEFGYLSVLVNNAGITTQGRKDILSIDEKDMEYLLKVNLIAPFILTSLLVPFLEKAKDRSYVINISSISAYTVSNNRADYCISKAGMSMMTQQFAVRLSDMDIGVFEIRPGIIKTEMTAPVQNKYDDLIENGLLPIRRWGEGSDIATAVLGVVKGYFPYSTGEVLNIDGGFHIRNL